MKKNNYIFSKILSFILLFTIGFNYVSANTGIVSSYSSINENYKLNNSAIDNLELYCNYSLIMDAKSGNVLFNKKGFDRIYPASTTKILTAILTVENLKLTDTVVVSSKALSTIEADSSVMGAKVGEVISVQNLLYGLLLPSGNDAANILAEAVSGNITDFVELMNKKAKEIGCQNTHFNNAHGYFDPDHYSTPYDMALILKYALKYKDLTNIMETLSIQLPKSNKNDKERTINNSNKMINKDYPDIYYPYILGGKTGYTLESRGTFVGYGKKDDKLVIITDFDGSQNINGYQARFLDAKELLEYAYNNFSNDTIINKEKFIYNVIDKATNKKYILRIDNSIDALTNNNSNRLISYNLNINMEDLKDTSINQKVGDITILSNGNGSYFKNTYNINLEKIENTNTLSSFSILIKNNIYIILLILILVLVILINILKKDKKRKLRKKLRNKSRNKPINKYNKYLD